METTKKLFDPNSNVSINFNPVAPLHHDLHMLQVQTHFLQNERSGISTLGAHMYLLDGHLPWRTTYIIFVIDLLIWHAHGTYVNI